MIKTKKYIYLVCAILLFVAIFNLPIAYYDILRILIFTGSIVALIDAEKNIIPKIIFVLILILFNPIIPIYLREKSYWIPFDFMAAIFFVIQALKIKNIQNKESKVKTTKSFKRDKIY